MKFSTLTLTLSFGMLVAAVVASEEPAAKEVSPPACSLDEKALEERKNTVLKEVREKASRIERTKAGYLFRLPRNEENLQLATSVIVLESECCPFFTFQIEAPAGSDEIQFTITAPTDAQDFMDDLFAANQ